MLRRALPVNCALAASTFSVLTGSYRFGHHAPTTHDFSDCWSRKLTPEEEEALRIQQKYRPVSAVVPGKMFMRHWIASNQSTLSVMNRVISGIISVCLMIWACGYATLGYNGHNCAHVVGWVFVAYWLYLHTHVAAVIPATLLGATLQLLVN